MFPSLLPLCLGLPPRGEGTTAAHDPGEGWLGQCATWGCGAAVTRAPGLCLCPGRDEFNIQVLHAFVELHEFTDLNLVQALR